WRDRAAGVRVIDAQTHQALEFRARVVFLCASTLESTRILLNSKTPRFPTGLANSSGALGKNLMDHIMGGGAGGTIPGMEDHAVHGHRPNGIYVPRFRNVKASHPDLLRGYGFQGGADRAGWGRMASPPGRATSTRSPTTIRRASRSTRWEPRGWGATRRRRS